MRPTSFLLTAFAFSVPANAADFAGPSAFATRPDGAPIGTFVAPRDFLAPQPSRLVDNRQAWNQVAQQSALFQGFRSWRDALRGQGDFAGRSFMLAPRENTAPDGNLHLRLGVRAASPLKLVGSAQTPGVEVSWNRLAFGSTAPLRVLNNALRPLDNLIETPNAASNDESDLMWFVARPLQEKNASLQLMMLRGRRDLTPSQSDDNRFAAGDVWGARGEFSLTTRWKLNTEWSHSRSEEEKLAAQAWKLELAGPISHPWGEAQFNAQMTDVDWGYRPFTGVVTSEGQQRNEVALRQNIAAGRLSGALALSWNQVARKESEAPTSDATTLQTDAIEGHADLNWRVSPALSVVTKHKQRVVTDSLSTQQNTMQQVSDDAGVQLKLARSLDLAVTTGILRTERNLLSTDKTVPVSLRTENRATVGLQHQTKSRKVGINFSRQLAVQEFDQNIDTLNNSIALEGEQRLSDWLHLRGTMRLSGQDDWQNRQFVDAADRSLEAQFSLRKLGKLSLRLSDWQERRDAATSAISYNGTRETGVRYNFDKGSGLGLSLEYSRREQAALDAQNQWRVGITYK